MDVSVVVVLGFIFFSKQISQSTLHCNRVGSLEASCSVNARKIVYATLTYKELSSCLDSLIGGKSTCLTEL